MKKFFPLIVLTIGILLVVASLFTTSVSEGNLDVEIKKTSFIMPAAHHVYANSKALNGKYYLFKAKVTNSSAQMLEDVSVRYRVPGYIDWTELTVVGEMLPGQTATVLCYPKFPENITEKMTESLEKAEIEITWDGADQDDVVEESFTFKITNRNDFVFTGIPPEEIASWSDVHSNDELLACFVTPNDPIVKYYTQTVQEKILKGEAATVTRDPKDAVRFLMGIYEATRLSHMVYSGTSGMPKSLDDVQSFSQHNRLPREVITGNTGLCLELSLLYSSMLSAAGIDPIIFLVPGHAYPGFRMNNQYYALEATDINGEGLGGIATVEEAFKKGQKQLKEFMQRAQLGDPRYTMIDVHALHQQGATPMALKDDEFMRQKVDKIAANFMPSVSQGAIAKAPPAQAGGGNNAGATNVAASKRTAGPLSVQIPDGWQVYNKPSPDMPLVSVMAFPADQSANVMVYDVPATSLAEAMNILAQHLSYRGSQIQYNIQGNTLTGQTYSQNGTWVWKGKAAQTSAGVRIVATGTTPELYNQQPQVINAIFNSIR